MRAPLKRYKVRVSNPDGEYWTDPIEARDLRQAIGRASRLVVGVLGTGGHLTIVPEESWPAAAAEGMQR